MNYRVNNTFKLSRGFTLIELVVVILILAILAIIASSKFINFRRSSIVSTMDGMESAMLSAATLVYSKASIAGVEKLATYTLDIDGVAVTLAYGYPDGTETGINLLMNVPNGEWKKRPSVFPGAWVYWHGTIVEDAGPAACYLRYRQAVSSSALPIINVETTGC